MKKLSTLFYCALITGCAFAQIPNPSFESWTAHTGYDTPDSWGNLNAVTSVGSVYTCEKGSPGASGAYYLKLTSKTVPIVGAVPGLAVTGSINTTSFSVSGGFSFTSRPATLTGQWQYMASGADHGHIAVLLSKWNSATNKKDTVAFTDSVLPSMAMSWAAFAINLKYYSGKYPDTAMILLSSSGTAPVAGSYLYIDTLAFAGNVPSGVVTVKNNAAPTVLYPNPANGNTGIFYYSVSGGSVSISIFDLGGKKLRDYTTAAEVGENTFMIDVSGLVHGMYVLSITDELGGTEQKKLIVQ